MEQLKIARANRKNILAIAYKATKRTALELNRGAVLAHRQLLMTAFKLFEKASNEYLEILEREEDVQCAEDYYDTEEMVYIGNLKILNSAMDELSRYSYIIDSSSNCVSAVSPLLNVSTAVMLPACEPELSHVPQNEASESVTDEHIPLPDIHPNSSVALPCPEHISAFESKITNLLQEEQSMCIDHEHIPLSEVTLDSSVSPSCPEICFESHRYTSQNYHDQQTINLHQCAIQLCIDNLSADQMSKHVHDDEYDNHSSNYETLFKQLQPWSISVQPLNTVDIMCLSYSANNPPNIDDVNVSGMLVGQNLPGG